MSRYNWYAETRARSYEHLCGTERNFQLLEQEVYKKKQNLSLCAVSLSNTWNVGDKQGVTRCRRVFGGFSADIPIFRLSKLRYITFVFGVLAVQISSQ